MSNFLACLLYTSVLEALEFVFVCQEFAVQLELGRKTVRVEGGDDRVRTFGTTYVVDRNGNIVGEPIVGAITEENQAETLQKLIDQALAADMG